jgi:hypothetical protein
VAVKHARVSSWLCAAGLLSIVFTFHFFDIGGVVDGKNCMETLLPAGTIKGVKALL